MNALIWSSLAGFAAIACIRGQGLPTNSIDLAGTTNNQWIWGSSTNGIVGGVFLSYQPQKHKTEYWVYVHEDFRSSPVAPPPTFHFEPNTNSLSQSWFLKEAGDTNSVGRYLKAPNAFCGPVELRDMNGVSMSPRNPILVSSNSYPRSFRQSELGQRDPFHANIAAPLGGRLPQLAAFKIEDLFEIKKAGDYLLTVWPKIYRQVKNDDDLCERIDLVPISLKIHFSPPPEINE
jgi:hypothetical protein